MIVPKARRLPSGTWRIQMRLGGESIPVTARTEKECIRQAQFVKSEYLAGKRALPEEKGLEPEKLPTLSEAIDKYINARRASLSPATLRNYISTKKNRFPEIMDRSLSDLSADDYISACQAEAGKVSAKTLKNAWGFVKSVIAETTKAPAPEVSLPQVVPNERPFLTADQIKVFVEAVHGTQVEIPALLALCSMRRSEILGLRWEHVDLAHRRILVKGAVVPGPDGNMVEKPENKNRTSTRYVPILMDELVDALKKAQKPTGRVVDRSANTMWTTINEICAEHGLPKIGFHGLRHSFASLAHHLRVPEDDAMKIGGWSDYQTMKKIYTHIDKMDTEKYIGEFEGFFRKNAHENAYED